MSVECAFEDANDPSPVAGRERETRIVVDRQACGCAGMGHLGGRVKAASLIDRPVRPRQKADAS